MLGAAGLWLILLIVGAVTAAAIIFSATQFQARFAGLTLYGGPLSAWKADQLRDEWAAALEVLGTAKTMRSDKQRMLATSYSMRNDLSEKSNQAGLEQAKIRARLKSRIARIDPATASKLNETLTVSEFIQIVAAALDVLKTQEEALNAREKTPVAVITRFFRSKDKSIEEQLEDLNAADTRWIDILGQLSARQSEADRLTEEIEQSTKELAQSKKNAQLIISSRNDKPVSEEQLIQIENTIYEFQTMFRDYFPVYFFALAPSDVLVLVLVIAMGILGSSMQLSHIYLNEYGSKRASFYLFRPFLGVITAFVVFIVMKTGIPLFTDVNRIGGTTTINPYFISFLAIISGLLAERALEWVRQLGARYFQDTDAGEQPRWARENLTAKFEAVQRDPKEARLAIKAKESEFDGWMAGKEPVPSPAQTLIAAILGIPRRDLFTDLPPEDKATAV